MLAIKGMTDSIEGAKADSLGLARFEDGKVGVCDADDIGQFTQFHLFDDFTIF